MRKEMLILDRRKIFKEKRIEEVNETLSALTNSVSFDTAFTRPSLEQSLLGWDSFPLFLLLLKSLKPRPISKTILNRLTTGR